jgi:hypothetical protein
MVGMSTHASNPPCVKPMIPQRSWLGSMSGIVRVRSQTDIFWNQLRKRV